MRIVSLNAYFGFCFDELMEFVKREAPTTDVFCFQEVSSAVTPPHVVTTLGRRSNLLEGLQEILVDFDLAYTKMGDDVEVDVPLDGHSEMGIVTFVKRAHQILRSETVFIANGPETFDGEHIETLGHVALRTDIVVSGYEIAVVNVHGISEPGDKRDCEVRLEQSRRVLSLVANANSEIVIVGDFNLFPDTESIQMIEKAGYRNLVLEYGITTTRGTNMHKLWPQYEHGKYGFQEFADYVFVSPGIRVADFAVPDLPISDHLPLILDISR
jgi:hypothetical protein